MPGISHCSSTGTLCECNGNCNLIKMRNFFLSSHFVLFAIELLSIRWQQNGKRDEEEGDEQEEENEEYSGKNNT
jgi:hypothetical protein